MNKKPKIFKMEVNGEIEETQNYLRVLFALLATIFVFGGGIWYAGATALIWFLLEVFYFDR